MLIYWQTAYSLIIEKRCLLNHISGISTTPSIVTSSGPATAAPALSPSCVVPHGLACARRCGADPGCVAFMLAGANTGPAVPPGGVGCWIYDTTSPAHAPSKHFTLYAAP